MRMAEAQETAQERNALRGLLSSGVDLNTPEGLAQLRRTAPMLAPQFEQAAGQRAYQTAQAARLRAQTQADQIKTARDLLSGVSNQAQWDAWRRSTVAALPEYADAIPTQFSPQNVQRVAEGAEGLIRRASEGAAAGRPNEFERALLGAGIRPGSPEWQEAMRGRATSLTGGRAPREQAFIGPDGRPLIVNLDTGVFRLAQETPTGAAPATAPPVDLRRPQAVAPAAPAPANMMLPNVAAPTLAAGPSAVPTAAAPTTFEQAQTARDVRAVTQAGATAEAEARGRVAAPPAPRQDFRYTQDFEAVEPIPGSAAAREAADREKAARVRRETEQQTGGTVIRAIDDAEKTIRTAVLPTTGFFAERLSGVGGTAARNLREDLNTIRSNIGFDQLNQMRQASPTGGALGNVSNQEIAYLQAVMGSVDQSQSEAQLRRNLRRLREAYLEIVNYGLGNRPPVEIPNPGDRGSAEPPPRDGVPDGRRPAAGATPAVPGEIRTPMGLTIRPIQ
jgi:hypothetical protein